MIFVSDIQREVARRWKVPLSSMTAPVGVGTNDRRTARVRQIAISLSVRLTKHSKARIGHMFGGRDHTTVIHACREVAHRRYRNRRMDAAMWRTIHDLVGGK